MDDPNVTQDPSQTTPPSPGDPSAKQEGTPPVAPPTLTKEEQERQTKAVNDALSAAGRDAKTITEKTDEAEKILKAAQKVTADQEAETERRQKELDDQAREAVKTDPEALKSVNERIRQGDMDRKQAKRQREQDAKEKDLDDREKQVKVLEKTRIAAEVAVANDVDMDQILKLAKDDTRKAMEEIAKHLPKKGTKTSLKVDPSKTAGAGEKSEEQKLRARYPTMHKK